MKSRNIIIGIGIFAAMTTPASAEPVTLAVTAFLVDAGIGAATAAAITTALVGVAVSTGLSRLSGAIFPNRHRDEPSDTA